MQGRTGINDNRGLKKPVRSGSSRPVVPARSKRKHPLSLELDPAPAGASLSRDLGARLKTSTREEVRREELKLETVGLRTGAIEALRTALIYSEKCELAEAQKQYEKALEIARTTADSRLVFEALSGLLRLAGEALDAEKIEAIDQELEHWMGQHRSQVPSSAWYCRGAVARHQERLATAQHCFLMALRCIREEEEGLPGVLPGDRLWLSRDEKLARTWLVLAAVQARKGKVGRARLLAGGVFRRFGARRFRTLNGIFYLLIGKLDENEGRLELALESYRHAHSAFLGEHHWYYSLSVLFAYARIARLQRHFAQALWHLDLVEKACSGDEFKMMRREIKLERDRLEADQVDLMIDSRKAVIQTSETGLVSLGKQYVLLQLLEALAEAHGRVGEDAERGLSKAELIEKVWGERYRPQAHDNKLYYNINRLRKLLEKDMREPKYIQNWREGYRLAPGLRVRRVLSSPMDWVQQK